MKIYFLFVLFCLNGIALDSRLLSDFNQRKNDSIVLIDQYIFDGKNPLELYFNDKPKKSWQLFDLILLKNPAYFEQAILINGEQVLPFKQICSDIKNDTNIDPLLYFGRVVLHSTFIKFATQNNEFDVVKRVLISLQQIAASPFFLKAFINDNHEYIERELFDYFCETLPQHLSSLRANVRKKNKTDLDNGKRTLELTRDILEQLYKFYPIQSDRKYSGFLEYVLIKFTNELTSHSRKNRSKSARDAAYKKYIPIIKWLLTEGADINVHMHDGELLWHYFIRTELNRSTSDGISRPWPTEIINIIIDSCAHVYARGHDGQTIFDKINSATFHDVQDKEERTERFMGRIFHLWPQATIPADVFFGPLLVNQTDANFRYCAEFFTLYPRAINATIIEKLFFKNRKECFDLDTLLKLVGLGQDFNEANYFENLLLGNPIYVFKMMASFNRINDEILPILTRLCERGFNLNNALPHTGDTLMHYFARQLPWLIRDANYHGQLASIREIIASLLALGANFEIQNCEAETPRQISERAGIRWRPQYPSNVKKSSKEPATKRVKRE